MKKIKIVLVGTIILTTLGCEEYQSQKIDYKVKTKQIQTINNKAAKSEKTTEEKIVLTEPTIEETGEYVESTSCDPALEKACKLCTQVVDHIILLNGNSIGVAEAIEQEDFQFKVALGSVSVKVLEGIMFMERNVYGRLLNKQEVEELLKTYEFEQLMTDST